LLLHGAGLSGPAQTALDALQPLQGLAVLDISNNQLAGELSVAWSNGIGGWLQVLNLSSNPLTVRSASGWPQSLVALQELDLSGTQLLDASQLLGSLACPQAPAADNGCWQLQRLLMEASGLSGWLPSGWSMPTLRVLDLAGNSLQGELSRLTAGPWPHLRTLNVSSNPSLSGQLPAGEVCYLC
jgi:Leucine-rich repeat (LRR) protein